MQELQGSPAAELSECTRRALVGNTHLACCLMFASRITARRQAPLKSVSRKEVQHIGWTVIPLSRETQLADFSHASAVPALHQTDDWQRQQRLCFWKGTVSCRSESYPMVVESHRRNIRIEFNDLLQTSHRHQSNAL